MQGHFIDKCRRSSESGLLMAVIIASRQKKRPPPAKRLERNGMLENKPPLSVGLLLIYHTRKGNANGNTTPTDNGCNIGRVFSRYSSEKDHV